MGAVGSSVALAAGAGLGWVSAQAVGRLDGRSGVLAAGQGPSADSRLPGWYAPVCAGYDVAYAARLAR
jgi:hypothetical protein